MKERNITREYLRDNPNHIFVFGDNTTRKGSGGAAILRDEPNTYGFITQNTPSSRPGSRYTVNEYLPIYTAEIKKLKDEIVANPQNLYMISRVGGGIANQHGIWEKIIEPNIRRDLAGFTNVEFLWSNECSREEEQELLDRYLKVTGNGVTYDVESLVKYVNWLQNEVCTLEGKLSRVPGPAVG